MTLTRAGKIAPLCSTGLPQAAAFAASVRLMGTKFRDLTLTPKQGLMSFLDEMGKCGVIESHFYEPKRKAKSVDLSLDTSIHEFSDFLKQSPMVEEFNGFESLDFCVLNRLEFQASIATKYLQGGVYGSPTNDEKLAMEVAFQLVNDIFPISEDLDTAVYDDFYAFKITSESWCNAITGAISWCYVVRDPYLQRWWFVYFNSDS